MNFTKELFLDVVDKGKFVLMGFVTGFLFGAISIEVIFWRLKI